MQGTGTSTNPVLGLVTNSYVFNLRSIDNTVGIATFNETGTFTTAGPNGSTLAADVLDGTNTFLTGDGSCTDVINGGLSTGIFAGAIGGAVDKLKFAGISLALTQSFNGAVTLAPEETYDG